MQEWVTRESVTVTRTVTEFHGPAKILFDYLIPVATVLFVLWVLHAAAVGKLPRQPV